VIWAEVIWAEVIWAEVIGQVRRRAKLVQSSRCAGEHASSRAGIRLSIILRVECSILRCGQ